MKHAGHVKAIALVGPPSGFLSLVSRDYLKLLGFSSLSI